ncbi:hypothetical protein ACOSJ1_EBGNOMHC_05879 [Bacillus mycoides KBAB4]|nr:hypothetical protein ACOSJ1_EBGNOMHC_05879 [Bacillus mycoides KBAB4]
MRAGPLPQKLVQSCDSAGGLAAAMRAGGEMRAAVAVRTGAGAGARAGLAGASADAVAARMGTDAGSGA